MATPPTAVPRNFVPWWEKIALKPLRPEPQKLFVDVNSLIVDALKYSAQVQAVSDNAIIAETAITQAEAEFDAHAFMDSKFVRTSVPTGSVLDAGVDVPRLREGDWSYNAGLKQKNQFGGRWEMAQQLGTRYSNSNFFFPQDQGNSRLTLSYNQPLLNGAGRAYNSSLIVLATIDTSIASDRTAEELQDHLLLVTEALWELYFQRSVLLQKQRHLGRAEVILRRLEKRRKVDALASQIARARAAVAERRAELIRANAAIRNGEARLRALVNSPTMLANRLAELVPIQPPMREFVPLTLQDAVITALENRPEIDVAAKEIQAARVRLNIARNELLPALDVVLETYVNGLRGDYDLGRSLIDQFSLGEPSYSAGLVFEVPLYRRSALAAQRRREAEVRQLSNRFRAAVENLTADVEVAVREVETAYREMQAKYQSMVAAESDVRYLERRWERLPGDDQAASFLLEDLLDAQDRLVFAEFGFAQSQMVYTVSLTRLNRATGTLLKHERIEQLRADDGRLPSILFEKVNSADPPPAVDLPHRNHD